MDKSFEIMNNDEVKDRDLVLEEPESEKQDCTEA